MRRAGYARRGSALLAVLWLSAALAAIAFSVASTVRSETERTATTEEDIRAYYLATGAIERAALDILRGQMTRPDGEPYFTPGQSSFQFEFPAGVASVSVIPETSKLDLNAATPEMLAALVQALGAPPEQAGTVAQAIVDWRSPAPPNGTSPFDELYLAMKPSFEASHASFSDVEELLSVAGVTGDLFYGSWIRQPSGTGDAQHERLVARGALRDCVSIYGATAGFDANTVEPAVMAAAGLPPDEIQALVARRSQAPFRNAQGLADFGGSSILRYLSVGSHSITTLRATARVRRQDGSISDLKRVVAAVVKFMPSRLPNTQVLRWYDRG